MPTNHENTPIKHTPGPWLPDFSGTVRDTAGNEVAYAIRLADLPLIAAAPELLALLKEALSQAEHYGPTNRDELGGDYACSVIERARAAIAKAEGKQ